MKQIVIISGKGGTGKTILTASFASLAKSKVMADCDVDAADLHLLLHPTIIESHEFSGEKLQTLIKRYVFGAVNVSNCVDLMLLTTILQLILYYVRDVNCVVIYVP